MLVDLGRNDVGRVAEFGTVRLTAFMEIERYSHVMHLVSEVRGQPPARSRCGGRVGRLLSRGNGHGGAEGAGHADHR